ncbi:MULTISPECIES: hypothetical protein [unclassified Kribbella]|uniref:hypothetical protein n=1 Tax=unclassified Kribbella TaxID=2644121 RepID=UPI0033C89BE5
MAPAPIVEAVMMKKRVSWPTVLTTFVAIAVAVLFSFLSEIVSDRAEQAWGYPVALTVTSLAAIPLVIGGLALRRSVFPRQPPRVFTAADQAWHEALADREVVPGGSKELRW